MFFLDIILFLKHNIYLELHLIIIFMNFKCVSTARHGVYIDNS